MRILQITDCVIEDILALETADIAITEALDRFNKDINSIVITEAEGSNTLSNIFKSFFVFF